MAERPIDREAVVALMATDGWCSSPNTAGREYTGVLLEDDVKGYDNEELTQVGPTTVIETPVGYEVAGAERWVDPHNNDEQRWALDHDVLVEQDGQLRVASRQVISTIGSVR